MSDPWTHALNNPTNFPRSDTIPIPGIEGQTNSVEVDFANIGWGESNLYDNAKDANTGVNAGKNLHHIAYFSVYIIIYCLLWTHLCCCS